MKKLLITHTDLDGISPVILLNLTDELFDYKCVDINDLKRTIDELKETDLSLYDQIYITDLSLTDEMYEIVKSFNKNVLVFDHHETHLFANKYDFVNVSIDYNGRKTCGTELFFNYLKEKYEYLNKENIINYVEYVRELDNFTFTSEIPKQLDMLKDAFSKADFIKTMTRRLKKDKPFSFTSFEKRYIKIKEEEIKRYIQKKEKEMFKLKIDGIPCAISFAESNKSILGNYIATKHKEVDIVIIINAANRISYRASKDNVDVSIFATNYGGGGHKLASGSKFDDQDRMNIIKTYFKDVKELDENC